MEGNTLRNHSYTDHAIKSDCHNQPMETKTTEQVHTQQAGGWEGGK